MINEGEPQSLIEKRKELFSRLKRLYEETQPEDWSFQNIERAGSLLVELFPNNDEIKYIATAAGLTEAQIAWDERPINSWSAVIKEASYQPVGIIGIVQSALDYYQQVNEINTRKFERFIELLKSITGTKPELVMLFGQLADLIRLGVVNLSDGETSRVLEALRTIDFKQ